MTVISQKSVFTTVAAISSVPQEVKANCCSNCYRKIKTKLGLGKANRVVKSKKPVQQNVAGHGSKEKEEDSEEQEQGIDEKKEELMETTKAKASQKLASRRC